MNDVVVAPRCVFNLDDAHLPNAPAAPVRVKSPTKAPSSAQNKNMRMFHPSANDAAMASATCINANAMLPWLMIKAPDKIPKNKDTITSFVANAKTIAKSGGMSPQAP